MDKYPRARWFLPWALYIKHLHNPTSNPLPTSVCLRLILVFEYYSGKGRAYIGSSKSPLAHESFTGNKNRTRGLSCRERRKKCIIEWQAEHGVVWTKIGRRTQLFDVENYMVTWRNTVLGPRGRRASYVSLGKRGDSLDEVVCIAFNVQILRRAIREVLVITRIFTTYLNGTRRPH